MLKEPLAGMASCTQPEHNPCRRPLSLTYSDSAAYGRAAEATGARLAGLCGRGCGRAGGRQRGMAPSPVGPAVRLNPPVGRARCARDAGIVR